MTAVTEAGAGPLLEALAAKDGHGWVTSSAANEVHRHWDEQARGLKTRLASEKAAVGAPQPPCRARTSVSSPRYVPCHPWTRRVKPIQLRGRPLGSIGGNHGPDPTN